MIRRCGCLGRRAKKSCFLDRDCYFGWVLDDIPSDADNYCICKAVFGVIDADRRTDTRENIKLYGLNLVGGVGSLDADCGCHNGRSLATPERGLPREISGFHLLSFVSSFLAMTSMDITLRHA